MVPGGIIDANADEPPEEKVVFEPFHQQSFRTDRIEGLQQHGPQQLLRSNRRPPDRRIERGKLLFKRHKRLVNNQPDCP